MEPFCSITVTGIFLLSVDDLFKLSVHSFDLIVGLAETITKAVNDAFQAAQCAPSHPVPTSSIQEDFLKQTEGIKV